MSNTRDEIRSRLDIVDLIGEYVVLRRSGRAYIGFCPFHPNTRTPAFTVYPDTQSFYCFGCQASGSIFDFVMRHHNIDFREALALLAQRAGVALRPRTPEEDADDRQRARLLELNELAARYFHYILMEHRGGQPGRDYLVRRGLHNATAHLFQLGYSLNSWNHLLSYLTKRKGYTPEEVLAAGLAVQRDNRLYDRFRGRLMFPIRTAQGEVVGFGARALDETTPKYLNTPQTLIFDKSQVLYGFDQARAHIRREDVAVVVEGYLDVLMAHQHGFCSTVAPLGTALTKEHARLLKKTSQNVILALDADAAGERATLRGITALYDVDDDVDTALHAVVTAQGVVRWASDLHVRVLRMPAGQDPDDVIRNDPEQWRTLLAQALPVMDFYLQRFTNGLDLSKPHDQRIALERLIPLIGDLDATQQHVYAAQLERLTGIKIEVLLDLIHRATASHTLSRPSSTPAESQHYVAPAPTPIHTSDYRLQPPPSYDDYLLSLLLRYPTLCGVAEEQLRRDLAPLPMVGAVLGTTLDRLFERTEHRMIWYAWSRAGFPSLANGPITKSNWVDALEPMTYQYMQQLLQGRPPNEYHARQEVQKCVQYLQRERTKRWIRQLTQQLEGKTNSNEARQVEQLLSSMHHYLALLQRPPSNSFYDADLRETWHG